MKALGKLTFCCLLALTGCASGGSWVELGGKRFNVEVANTDALREKGLMFREELAADHGMLFVHERQEPLAYWMKNTHIPLDILYNNAMYRPVRLGTHARRIQAMRLRGTYLNSTQAKQQNLHCTTACNYELIRTFRSCIKRSAGKCLRAADRRRSLLTCMQIQRLRTGIRSPGSTITMCRYWPRRC
jgi:hypothetical protein